jgi:hypothetical protein
MAPHNPTMKNLPSVYPSLEIITLSGGRVRVTLERPSKAELDLPIERTDRPGAQSIPDFASV